MKNPRIGALPYMTYLNLVLFLISCNAPAPSPSDPASSDSQTVIKPVTPPVTGPLSNSFVNQLWTDATSFTNLKGADKKKLTFRFQIESYALTLAAWSNDSASADYPGTEQEPVFTMTLGGTSGTSIGQGTYLGNLVLNKDQVKAIIKSLKNSKDPYVVFTPVMAMDGSNQLTYEVSSRKTMPNPISYVDKANLAAITTTNPSPPKNSN